MEYPLAIIERRHPLILRAASTLVFRPLYGAGAAGPVGPPGPPGGGAFDFIQLVASDTWVINHNLNYKPVINLYSAGGVEMFGTVVHTNNNQVIVTFNTALIGTARLV